MRVFVLLIAAPFAVPAGSADAAQRAWVPLGSITASLGADNGTIRVQNSGRHRQMRLCVSRRSTPINSYRISFTRGGEQTVRVRRTLRPGECTSTTNLHRAPRGIRTVWVSFARVRHSSRPVIQLEAR